VSESVKKDKKDKKDTTDLAVAVVNGAGGQRQGQTPEAWAEREGDRRGSSSRSLP
jgi:hypothetical protein